MHMNTLDMLKKKLLDAQEMVRDYEMFSKQTEDREVANLFKEFAEESGRQAQKLQGLMEKYKKI